MYRISFIDLCTSIQNIEFFKEILETPNKYDLDLEYELNCEDYGCTPLNTACYSGIEEYVDLLLKAGANPHYKNKHGLTALITAIAHNNPKCVILLLKAGSFLYKPYTNKNIYSAIRRFPKIFKILKRMVIVNLLNHLK